MVLLEVAGHVGHMISLMLNVILLSAVILGINKFNALTILQACICAHAMYAR